jgi:hypothetical protein
MRLEWKLDDVEPVVGGLCGGDAVAVTCQVMENAMEVQSSG